MPLSDVQRLKIKELASDPVFVSILQDIEAMRRVPRYRPTDKPIDERFADWAYQSGIDKGIEKVLKFLQYE